MANERFAAFKELVKKLMVSEEKPAAKCYMQVGAFSSKTNAGPVYSADIIAEIGDINRFDSQSQLAKYAGLAWYQHQSGDYDAQNTRLIRSGNRFLKYYLCEAALFLVRCDTEYRRLYNLKFKEVSKFQHKRALALTARKFVHLVFRLLKDNRLYTPAE